MLTQEREWSELVLKGSGIVHMVMKYLKNEYHILTKKIKEIEHDLKNAPEGYLKISNRKKDYSYYHMKNDQVNKKEISQYLSKKKEETPSFIEKLVQKQYYQKLLPVMKEEKKAIEEFLTKYDPQKKYDIYEKTTQPRKQFITPAFLTPEMKTQRWESEEYQPNPKYPENLIYETNRGDMVRSKSEIIIADLLYYHKDYCAYRYESPLYVSEKGMVLYPDFTIMKRSAAEIFYWEHFGMMDVESYVDTFIRKMNEYILAGIYPGKQLICTFESSAQPLETKVVRNLIKEYFL